MNGSGRNFINIKKEKVVKGSLFRCKMMVGREVVDAAKCPFK
jgi:hypothetical protein